MQCQFCSHKNKIETSSSHNKPGPNAYDINTKATLASLHAGVDEKHLKSILSVMNSPPMSRATFKARQRETAKAVESVAKVSCEEVIKKEKLQLISSGAEPDENNLVSVHIFVLLPRSVNHTAYYSLATVLDIHLCCNRSNLIDEKFH